MKVSLKTLLSTTALTGGIWLACFNPAPACITAPNVTESLTKGFPWNLHSLTARQFSFLGAGAGIAALAALSLTRRRTDAASSLTGTGEDLLAERSFPIPIYPEAVASPTGEMAEENEGEKLTAAGQSQH